MFTRAGKVRFLERPTLPARWRELERFVMRRRRITAARHPIDAGGRSPRSVDSSGDTHVDFELVTERLFQVLAAGHRNGARQIISELREAGVPAEEVTHEVFWPVLEMISRLFRADQLGTLPHHYAIRLLRTLVDQAQAEYEQRARSERKIVMFSGASEADELAGQLVSDLLEAGGYEVYFGGGGIANDEVLGEVGEQRPDVLLMFASGPADAPNIRQLIDKIRGIGACPEMQIVVGGGIFNRAEGLAEEIGADLWARDPRELLQRLETQKDRRAGAQQRTVGRNRRPPKTQAA
jgi:methanogenic corrinoid protein MtbC1